MTQRLSTGIPGLDEVLHGGLLPGQLYEVRGTAGAGKTTLALQFLMEGVRRGEPALYVTLDESERDPRGRRLRGWDLRRRDPGDPPRRRGFSPEGQYTIFHPGDVELAPTTRKITEAMERLKPTRVVFDSLTEVGLLTRDAVRYRRQVLALKGFLVGRGTTTLFLAESNHPGTTTRSSLVHGVIALEQDQGPDGMDRRYLRVEKYRGSDYEAGEHALDLPGRPGGLPPPGRPVAGPGFRPRGDRQRDRRAGPAVRRGAGPGHQHDDRRQLRRRQVEPGPGLPREAARRGERAVLYSFDEGAEGSSTVASRSGWRSAGSSSGASWASRRSTRWSSPPSSSPTGSGPRSSRRGPGW